MNHGYEERNYFIIYNNFVLVFFFLLLFQTVCYCTIFTSTQTITQRFILHRDEIPFLMGLYRILYCAHYKMRLYELFPLSPTFQLCTHVKRTVWSNNQLYCCSSSLLLCVYSILCSERDGPYYCRTPGRSYLIVPPPPRCHPFATYICSRGYKACNAQYKIIYPTAILRVQKYEYAEAVWQRLRERTKLFEIHAVDNNNYYCAKRETGDFSAPRTTFIMKSGRQTDGSTIGRSCVTFSLVQSSSACGRYTRSCLQ